MKKILLIVLFLISRLAILRCYAGVSENCLWFEFDNPIESPQGIVTQPLFIGYGQFAAASKSIADLDGLDVFYTFGEKNKKREDVFYKAEIETINGRPCVRIISATVTWCAVIAIGRKINKVKYNYFAKTSFFLFGKNKDSINRKIPAENKILERRFNIGIYRERLKEFLNYNRLLGFPLRFKIDFDKSPFSNKDVCVIEENSHTYSLKTDRDGEFIYIPQDENNLDKPIRENYRHFLVYGEQKIEDKVYAAAYTVLLRVGYFNRNVNFALGISIFMISVIISLLIALKISRKYCS